MTSEVQFVREIRCTAFPLDCFDSSKKIQNDADVAAVAKASNKKIVCII